MTAPASPRGAPRKSCVGTRAVAFDLYGTLVEIGAPRFGRWLPSLEKVTRRDWIAFQREVLLRRSFPDRESFLAAVFERFGGRRESPVGEELRRRLDQELASVRPVPGALSTLAFLKRRGLRLGVLSNAASPYREPLRTLELEPWLDCILLSADLGEVKPAPATYRALADRLFPEGLEDLSSIVFLGDSWANDVEGPRSIGMRALWVGGLRAGEGVPTLAHVGWIDLDTLRPLISPGTQVELDGRIFRLAAVEPLAEEEQGRYNLVARIRLEEEKGSPRTAYLKRFLLPEACEIEQLLFRLVRRLGLPACPQQVLSAGEERLLLAAAAPGEKLEAPRSEYGYAREVGRHAAVAYLFANADLRPRNAFVRVRGEEVELTMLDYEHCLFNLAIELDGIEDPGDRKALEALGREGLAQRVRKRVLADAHMRRAYRAFLGPIGLEEDRKRAFAEGWCEVHEQARLLREEILDLLRDRLEADPPLIVGTHGYRRALLELDLEDLAARIDEPPRKAVLRCFPEGARLEQAV